MGEPKKFTSTHNSQTSENYKQRKKIFKSSKKRNDNLQMRKTIQMTVDFWVSPPDTKGQKESAEGKETQPRILHWMQYPSEMNRKSRHCQLKIT